MPDDAVRRPITPTDLYRMTAVEDPQISPDGKWIAFVRHTRREHDNANVRAIWLVRPDGSGLRQFTSGVKPDTSPRWSPDGKMLAFVSARNDKPQIYLMPVDGGEALALTYMPNGASSPTWSPDGKRIAFLASQRPDELSAEDEAATLPPASPADLPEPDAKADEARIDPRVIERLPYRMGTSYWDERFSQVYVVAVEPDEAGLRRPRRLTSEPRNLSTPRWSADGSVLYSTASRQPEHDMPSLFEAIVRIDAADGTLTELTGSGRACWGVRPSPDGKWLAFTTVRDELPTNQHNRLAVMPAEGGEITILGGEFDASVSTFTWQPDSSALLFTAQDSGAEPIYNVDLSSGAVTLVDHADAAVTGLDAGAGGLLAAAVFTADGQYELYGNGRRLTAFNRPLLDQIQTAPFEALSYAAPDGTAIDGWLVRPLSGGDGPYPLAVEIHGGPSGMWGPAEPTMWFEWQLLAARGYAVFFCNPRGSTGYGEPFTLSNHGDWGDGPMSDVLAGVDLLVERGIADPDRLALTGGSYGGYLTAWIVGNDQRFKAAVAQRGVYNLHAFHGTTDIPWFMTSNMKTEPWDDPARFWQQSPLAYAHQITTPLLIIHSEQDYRVPISEGEQLFAVVKRRGQAPVQLVRYPREGHELSRSGEPKHILDRLDRILGWFDQYCLGKPPQEG